MKKNCKVFAMVLVILMIVSLLLPATAQTVVSSLGRTVSLHPGSPWYIVNNNWFAASHNMERNDEGVVFISVDDFRTIFRCKITYNYDDLSIYVETGSREIWQGLHTPTMYVDRLPYPNPAPYISSEGGAVMVPAEAYASVLGYFGNYVYEDDYPPGKLNLSLYAREYTISRVEVNKAMQLVTVYGTDSIGNTDPIRHFICSTGNPTWRTPNGTYGLRPLRYSAQHGGWYYFPAHNCWVLYCTQISGDVCFHSVPFNGQWLSSLSTTGYANLANPASHGCIRLLIEDARFIWENCAGVPVVITDGFFTESLNLMKQDILRGKLSYNDYVSNLIAQY